MLDDHDLIGKLSEQPSDEGSNYDDSPSVTDDFDDEQGSTVVARGSGSGTQIQRPDHSPGDSLSGIHKKLLDDIREPRINIDLLAKDKTDLETLPLYILSGSQSPVILRLETDYIHAYLPLSCLDYGTGWPDEKETLREEIRGVENLQSLVYIIQDKESELLEIIGEAAEIEMQDFYARVAVDRAKREAKCKTNRRRKNRKKPEPNLGNTAITEKASYRRFRLLRTDIQGFLEQTKNYGLVELGALPYKTYQRLNLETGKLEDVYPSYKRFALGFPKEVDFLSQPDGL